MKTHFVTQIRQDSGYFDFGSSYHTLYTRFCVTCILQAMSVMSDQLSPVEEMLVPYLFKSLDLALDFRGRDVPKRETCFVWFGSAGSTVLDQSVSRLNSRYWLGSICC
jgi:hypothetical protein